jgi:hypothetical protein
MRLLTLMLFNAILLACQGTLNGSSSGLAPTADDCSELAPAEARPYEYLDDTEAPKLAGTYALTLVTTSAGGRPLYIRNRLWLAPTDSAHQNVGQAYRPLAGVYSWDDTTTQRPVPGSTPSTGDTVEVVSGRLYMGCRQCLGRGPTELRIIGVTPNEFWGIWEDPFYSSGDILTDSTNRVLPNPAGHYCARRLRLAD